MRRLPFLRPVDLNDPAIPAPLRDELRRSVQRRGPMPAEIVEPGQTLSHIALETFGDPQRWPTLAWVNGIDEPRLIQPGDLVVVGPPGSTPPWARAR